MEKSAVQERGNKPLPPVPVRVRVPLSEELSVEPSTVKVSLPSSSVPETCRSVCERTSCISLLSQKPFHVPARPAAWVFEQMQQKRIPHTQAASFFENVFHALISILIIKLRQHIGNFFLFPVPQYGYIKLIVRFQLAHERHDALPVALIACHGNAQHLQNDIAAGKKFLVV